MSSVGGAAAIPPALLAGVLGIDPTTAVKWTKLVSGDWTNYVAARALRTRPVLTSTD